MLQDMSKEEIGKKRICNNYTGLPQPLIILIKLASKSREHYEYPSNAPSLLNSVLDATPRATATPCYSDHASHCEIPAPDPRPTAPLSPLKYNIDTALRFDPRPAGIRSKPPQNRDSTLRRNHCFNHTTEPSRRSHSTPHIRNNSGGHPSLSTYEGRYRMSGKF
ncbi:unnamed protein product [Vicia faba]|uniref:Uncharacterized protein n=1 Tax=Vicia faba TaxID=3906 RepID=A0AAV1AYX2_VICFA|nr:unnamed protein product [Vicia faba]